METFLINDYLGTIERVEQPVFRLSYSDMSSIPVVHISELDSFELVNDTYYNPAPIFVPNTGAVLGFVIGFFLVVGLRKRR